MVGGREPVVQDHVRLAEYRDDSGHGFDNIGDVLTLPPMLLEKYLAAAKAVVTKAVPAVPEVPPEKVIAGRSFQRINVAAGVSPAVEGGILPPGTNVAIASAHTGSQVRSLTLRIDSVTVRGPLDSKYWVRPKDYERFFSQDTPKAAPARRKYAHEILEPFLRKAYRRPVDAKTVDRLVAIGQPRSVCAGLPGRTAL